MMRFGRVAAAESHLVRLGWGKIWGVECRCVRHPNALFGTILLSGEGLSAARDMS